MMKLSEELKWRGFVNQTTLTDIKDLDNKKLTFYLGTDPSAPSAQIGNLAVIMMARLFASHGHKAVLLVGGATGMIGDPDGKKQERDLLPLEQIKTNKASIAKQYKQVFGDIEFDLVDNYDWFKDIGYLDFLRDVGKHVPMRQMLGRDFVQSRLKEDGSGISYAEFSYSLIQGFDFVTLYRNKGCTLQICGADQWGNSITGVDLVRRMEGAEAHVWSAPLIVNKSTGIKFGKTEGGAVWLDANMTSPYKFYQFWLNTDDEGVGDYLKIYTLLNKEQVDDIMANFSAKPHERLAQRTLAYEVTKIVHGEQIADSLVRITNVLFGKGDLSEVSEQDFALIKQELPVLVAGLDDDLEQAIKDVGLASSLSEAKRYIAQGGVAINNNKVNANLKFSEVTLLLDKYILLRRGKNNYAIIEITSNQ
jgi:tyrosyl-tRNA synthetase